MDFLLTAKRDRKAALCFLRKAIGQNGIREKITIDKSGADTGGDTPAQRAGLLVGDEIVAADGAPFRPVLSFRNKIGSPVALLDPPARQEGAVETRSL